MNARFSPSPHSIFSLGIAGQVLTFRTSQIELRGASMPDVGSPGWSDLWPPSASRLYRRPYIRRIPKNLFCAGAEAWN
jgi:hypothetical protein